MRTTRRKEDWRALVDDYVAGGWTLREFCRDRGISRSSLSRWSQRFGHGQIRRSTRGHVVVELPSGIVVHVPASRPPSFIAAVVTALTEVVAGHG